jgi:hypothetical protein
MSNEKKITKETLDIWRSVIADGGKFATPESAIARLLTHAELLEEQVRQLREALETVRRNWNKSTYFAQRDALEKVYAALASTEPKEKA